MSLSTLTNDLGRPRGKQTHMAIAYNHVPTDSQRSDRSNSKAFDAIAKFIPTEVLAPYIVVMELIGTNQITWSATGVYLSFIIATPVLLILFEFAKAAEQGLEWPAALQLSWRALAAAIAFAIWSLSIPENPFQSKVGGIAVAGFLALLISPVLAAIDLIVMRVLAIKQ